MGVLWHAEWMRVLPIVARWVNVGDKHRQQEEADRVKINVEFPVARGSGERKEHPRQPGTNLQEVETHL